MSGRIALGFSLIGLSLALAGCGGNGASTTTGATTITDTISTTTTTTTTTPETTKLRVYFMRNGYVQPVVREVPKTAAVARAAFDALQEGPTAAEEELGLVSSLEPYQDVSVRLEKNGVLRVFEIRGATEPALAQIVYTMTQFPSVKQVAVQGKRYTRADFEDWTPLILVESPLPFEAVTSPIHATGTANTFEATFQYDVIGPDGKRLATHFVTATSGTGTRGTFDFTTKPFTAEGDGALVVYELSAKDGSRIHEVRIPLHFVAAK
jgi:hypothetical protein